MLGRAQHLPRWPDIGHAMRYCSRVTKTFISFKASGTDRDMGIQDWRTILRDSEI